MCPNFPKAFRKKTLYRILSFFFTFVMRFYVSIIPSNGLVSRCVLCLKKICIAAAGTSLTSPKLKLGLAVPRQKQTLAIQSALAAAGKWGKICSLLIAVTDSRYNCFLAPSQMFAVVFHFEVVKINEFLDKEWKTLIFFSFQCINDLVLQANWF